MNVSIISAMVSMTALQQRIDVIADNIANIDTVGYKRKEASFEDVLTNAKQQPAGFHREGRVSPMGFTRGFGMRLSQVQLNMEQGSISETMNPTDVAIAGNALFELETGGTDAGGNPNVAWTRSGAFQLVFGENDPDLLYLTDADGRFVREKNGGRIVIPANHAMLIDEQGNVRARDNANPDAPLIDVGQLKLMQVLRPQSLLSAGDSLFILPPELTGGGDDILQEVNWDDPAASQGFAVRQGALEQSNVNLANEMTELIAMQRSFQMSSRALMSSDTMMGLANSLRG